MLLSVTNRMGRTVDRVRQLTAEVKSGKGQPAEDLQQIRILLKRSEILRLAVTSAALSMFCSGTMILGIFLMTSYGWQSQGFIATAFFGSIGCLLATVVLFLWDVSLALKAVKLETAGLFS